MSTAKKLSLELPKGPVMSSIFRDVYRDFASRFDPSTKLGNHIKLADDIARIKNSDSSRSGALILVEILDHDLVRRIFLASGGKVTDDLLRDISERLAKVLTKCSGLYYVGVGRFAILTTRKNNHLESLMPAINEVMKDSFRNGNFKIAVDIVIGFLPMARAKVDPDDALRKATVATHKARTELCYIAHYDLAFDEIQMRKHRILQEIPAAISGNEFSLAFQPKINLGGLVVGAEALLRWTHPTLGAIGPAEFIPLADNTDLMIDITKWVVAEALRSRAKLVDEGVNINIALNVSSRNLNDPAFSVFLISILNDLNLPPSSIQVECTEYSALKSAQCKASLNDLSLAGVSIALDDFGSTYSNIACLQQIPISLLKIDKSLIAPIADSTHAMKLLEGVIKLGKTLGYKIAAEGVETQEVLQLLHFLDIDEMQGYAIAEPMNFDGLLDFVKKQPSQLFSNID